MVHAVRKTEQNCKEFNKYSVFLPTLATMYPANINRNDGYVHI